MSHVPVPGTGPGHLGRLWKELHTAGIAGIGLVVGGLAALGPRLGPR